MGVQSGSGEGAAKRWVTLPARPEPLRVAADETAVIVIDMQNAYASPGGYVDLAGFDISGAAGAAAEIAKVLETARGAGVQVVYLQNGWDADYAEAGGPGSPNWHKSNALKTMRARPELQGKLLARGGWDYELVEALAPQPGDLCLHKPRYSAFFNSQLDSALRARGIRNLVFVGIASNVCVESTLRDGFHLEYFGVLLEDATHHLGPDFVRDATLYNVETFFGWVSSVADFCGAFGQIGGGGVRTAPASPEPVEGRIAALGNRASTGSALAGGVHPDPFEETKMPFEPINPSQFPLPIAPYSAGTKAGNTVYVSGTLALGEGGTVLHPDDAEAQTRHVLETIRITLEAAGASVADVAFNHIFLTDWAHYPAMNAVYAEFFPGAKPARYCIQCGLVKPGLVVEIASVAHIG